MATYMYIVLYLRLWGSLRSLHIHCQAVGKLQTHNNHVCSLPSDKPVNKARLTHHSGSDYTHISGCGQKLQRCNKRVCS